MSVMNQTLDVLILKHMYFESSHMHLVAHL